MFDFLDQAFVYLGSLNNPRRSSGVIKKDNYLWVFGGVTEDDIPSFERISLSLPNSFFEVINIEN